VGYLKRSPVACDASYPRLACVDGSTAHRAVCIGNERRVSNDDDTRSSMLVAQTTCSLLKATGYLSGTRRCPPWRAVVGVSLG
jgi:hypothetical protein